MLQKILKFLGFKNEVQYKIQTFTFYVPSPPFRKSGYREKEFDSIFYEFINRGYEIISFQTQANTNPEHSGMWIICLVRALNDEADRLDLEAEFKSLNEKISVEISHHEEKIEGIYQID